MRTLAALTLALIAPIVSAHDHDHDHEPPPAPTIETATRVGTGDLTFTPVPGWCALPDERPLGNTHGGIVIDRLGRIYYNTDTDRAIMVHAPDGRFLHTIAAEFPGIHGMVLRTEGPEEFIYAAHLHGRQVLKLKLDGTVVWRMGVPIESGKYDDDPASYRPTGVAVAPGGDLYVADGYGRNWIHQFTKDRVYVRSFGGPGTDPGQFRTCHGLAIDTRGETPRLLVCDRENRRLQRFELDGTFVDVAATDLRRPCTVSFDGPRVAVAELEGRVTILGTDFTVLAHLGDNPERGQWANNGVHPSAWKDGVFTAPHACCFDRAGNLYVMDWNATGRISKLHGTDPSAPGDDTVRPLILLLITSLLLAAGGCRTGIALRDPAASAEQIAFTSGFDTSLWYFGWGRRRPPVNTSVVAKNDAIGFAPLRGPALRVKIAKGSHGGPEDLAMPLKLILGYEPEEIYFRYYLRFAEDWAPESSGKLPGVAGTYGQAGFGGRPANGRNGWSARAHFGPSRKGLTDYGFYVYHADMTRQHGDAWSWGQPMERKRWYCIEQHVRLNTPGKKDGVLQGWIDGKLSYDRRDVRFRDTPDLKIEKIWMDVYYGGPKTPPHDMHLYLDEITVARRRIGCGLRPEPASAAAPAPAATP